MKNIKFLVFSPYNRVNFRDCTDAANLLMKEGHEIEFRASESGLPGKGDKYFDVAIVHESMRPEKKLEVYGLNRTVIILGAESNRKPAAETGPWRASPADILEVVGDACADFAFVVLRSGKRMTSLSISE